MSEIKTRMLNVMLTSTAKWTSLTELTQPEENAVGEA
jgi:hypothetical protein